MSNGLEEDSIAEAREGCPRVWMYTVLIFYVEHFFSDLRVVKLLEKKFLLFMYVLVKETERVNETLKRLLIFKCL